MCSERCGHQRRTASALSAVVAKVELQVLCRNVVCTGNRIDLRLCEALFVSIDLTTPILSPERRAHLLEFRLFLFFFLTTFSDLFNVSLVFFKVSSHGAVPTNLSGF